MYTDKRTRSAIGVMVAVGVVLSGCGSDDSTNGDPASGGGTTSAPSTPGGSESHAMPNESEAPSGPETGDSQEPGVADVVITITDFTYSVPDTVPAGATITIQNDDSVGHTVTSDEDGVFDVPVGPGEEAQLMAPTEPGEYPFHCTPHPSMTATLVVA